VPLTILHTTDLHGHILPSYDYDGNEGVGGLLRCATYIESVRAQTPNVLLVDIGDTIQGSAESLRSGGLVMMEALRWLNYDAWVLGNHEFDWGLPALRKVHDACSIPILGANIGPRRGAEMPLPKVRPFLVREVDGVRLALVGLTTPGIPTWTLPDYLGDLQFESSPETISRILPAVRAENPDILVLLVHQGLLSYGDDHANEVNEIARRFPEFDVIIGGHSHSVQENVLVHGVLYTQAGYHANWVGRVDLVYDTVSDRLIEKRSEVVRMATDYAPHAGLREHLGSILPETESYLSEVIGHTLSPIAASLKLPAQSPLQQLLAKSIAAEVGAEIVIHGVLEDYEIPAGDITREQLWRIVPYENRIGVARLLPGEIRGILQENLDYAEKYYFQGVYGLRYDLVLARAGNGMIRNLRRADGTAFHGRERVDVAFNSYVLASGGRRYPKLRELTALPSSRLRLTGFDTRDAVEKYIRSNSPLDLKRGEEVEIVRKRAETP